VSKAVEKHLDLGQLRLKFTKLHTRLLLIHHATFFLVTKQRIQVQKLEHRLKITAKVLWKSEPPVEVAKWPRSTA
jgi:hypothetical protein